MEVCGGLCKSVGLLWVCVSLWVCCVDAIIDNFSLLLLLLAASFNSSCPA